LKLSSGFKVFIAKVELHEEVFIVAISAGFDSFESSYSFILFTWRNS
jgi:hypothetical protein